MRSRKNPFPGMNPYFQRRWRDVHLRLIAGVCEALAYELPDDLSARAEEDVVVSDDEAEKPRGYRPDVAVVETWRDGFPPLWRPQGEQGGALEVAEPIVVQQEPEVHRWIKIADARGELITAIEVLSPTNKSERDARDYDQRQQNFLDAGVNLVEIDFIRGGVHVTAVDPRRVRFPAGTCYHVCVTRFTPMDGRRCEVYPVPLRKPVPAFRVPLRLTDPDVPLALQPLLDRIYETGRYWHEDYSQPPEPPVAEEDLAWADERLRAAGLR